MESSTESLDVTTASESGDPSIHILGSGLPLSPLGLPSLPSGSGMQKRRSSSRSIKRKKFDDELVESSLIKSSRGRPLSTSSHGGQSSPFLIGEAHLLEQALGTHTERKKPSKSSKRPKKSKSSHSSSGKEVGRWKPTDDLALITAIQQTNDLMVVYQGVKFTCKFTLQDIQERWYSLLYNPVISKMAVAAMKQLHPEVVAAVQSKALFSEEEEELIAKVSMTPELTPPGIEIFQELLGQNQEVFYYTRTAKSLLNHWLLLKQYHLLADQTIQPIPKGEHMISFSDCEEQINDKELQDPTDEVAEHELAVADRKIKKEIRTLENELQKFQILVQVDSVTGISPPDFDTQTLAVLRGRLVRYLMRSREITLGRSTKDNNIDVDLTREGPAWKISRRQGLIKLRNNGDFYLANEGKRPFYIDGQPLLTGNKLKLNNNSVVEIAGLRFIFLINQDLINNIRTDPPRAGI